MHTLHRRRHSVYTQRRIVFRERRPKYLSPRKMEMTRQHPQVDENYFLSPWRSVDPLFEDLLLILGMQTIHQSKADNLVVCAIDLFDCFSPTTSEESSPNRRHKIFAVFNRKSISSRHFDSFLFELVLSVLFRRRPIEWYIDCYAKTVNCCVTNDNVREEFYFVIFLLYSIIHSARHLSKPPSSNLYIPIHRFKKLNTVDCCFSICEASSAFPVLNHHGQFVVFDENTIFMMFSALSKIMCLTSALTSRKVTWLIVVPQDLVLSRCFRDRVEEYRDAKIFFIEEPNRYSISTLLSESDISLVDCFYQLVPYLWYWLISNSLKPGEVFIRR